MISPSDLRSIARARLRDASVLLTATRYDGAVYLCGYAVEIALKARICKTLRWSGFPETPAEFQGRRDLKVHDLEALLRFTGWEIKIKNPPYASHWSQVCKWKPEDRYKSIGGATHTQARAMIQSAKVLLKSLLPR